MSFSENVAIAILSYNHPNLTERCIASVITLLPDARITVCHNGSRPEVINGLRAKFPSAAHLILPENRGFTGGTNALLCEVFKSSHWCMFITNDCEILGVGDVPQRSGMYAPLIYRRKTDKVDSLGGIFTPLLGRLRHHRSMNRKPSLIPWLERFYVPGTSFLIDRDTFSAVGLFDESLHTYWEDVDYSQRVLRLGFNLNVLPEIKLRHGIGKTCHKDPFYTSFLFKRNRKTISRRYLL